MRPVFLTLSILLPILSPWPYIRSILRGQTAPHRTTRLVYLGVGVLTTASLIASGDRVALWISAVSTFQAVVLFFLGLTHGVGGWTKTDIICLAMATVGIVAWQTTKDPVLGLYFGIIADFVGTVPTIIKSYRFPNTENWSFYGIDAIAGLCNVFAVTDWSLQAYVYPAYLVWINVTIALLAIRRNALTDVF